MVSTPQFYIYEFSKKFDNIHQENGIWVSGGFELDKTKEFFRSNYQSGNIYEIPDEIRQAVVNGLFEIPNAYPPNQLRDEEFYKLVANKQLDIAHPPLENIALIARELGDYCILAVATRQMDDKGFRAKLVGYRYFWLKTSDLNPQRPDLVDGIATLLSWWNENGSLCFDMNPSSYEHSPNKNQPYLGERVIYKQFIRNKYQPVSKIYKSALPCLFEPTTDRQFDVWNLHAQALHRVPLEPAWAWNVRKLTKPETFTVVYCADRASYDQFFSPVLKPIEPSATTGSITTTSGSPNQSQQSDSSLNASLTTPSRSTSSSSPQDTSDLEKYLKDVANNTESPSLRSLIEFYQKKPPNGKQHKDLWVNCVNKEVLKNPDKTLYQADVNYLMLVSVFIWDVQSQGKSGQQSTDNFSENRKKWAIDYLDALSGSISKYESTYKESVPNLKRNIANLRKSLSGEDESPGGDGKGSSDFPHSIIKLFIDIARRHYYQVPIILLILLVFFSFLPLEINPLKPMINKIFSVAPSPQERGSSKDENQKYTVQQLQAARKFIEEKSVTTECKDGGSFATPSECQIYKKTKSTLPDWPELPEPPQGAPITAGESSAPKMLARNRDKKNPYEMVIFLQQSLKISGAKKVGGLGIFDETLENAVKEFQKNKCKQADDGQVGEETWKCLSNYVQKQQVIAILDYRIDSLKKNNDDIEKTLEKCKKESPRKPEDFIKCVKPK
jgi:hypothetical protein